MRIQQSLEEGRREEAETDSRFARWRESWLDRRERIAGRLEFIEAQLDRLLAAPAAGEPVPQLALVAKPAEYDRIERQN